ncbi:LOW QUALITY PROTEIN: hypothetical protein ACHAXA_001096 [Cyclostephanos tholiformis]|uniref:Uncharacterized protein n=1 Tax=Cyclostephanos tholiformis TaxID=382380 RepID=A0ABD3RDF8_9STRA
MRASLVVGQRSSMESTARSTTMASVTRAKGDADAANAADANDEGVVDGVGREDQGRVEWGFLDYVKKMTSSCMCSLAMLLDDDDVTLHEGRIIGIPNRGEKYGMYRRSSSSDISSLTGDTPRIYQKRYYAEDRTRCYGASGNTMSIQLHFVPKPIISLIRRIQRISTTEASQGNMVKLSFNHLYLNGLNVPQ